MVGCAGLGLGSTCSFPSRREQRAVAGSPRWLCLSKQRLFSVSLPWASGGERGAAGVWVLRQRSTSLIYGGRERSELANNSLLVGNKL